MTPGGQTNPSRGHVVGPQTDGPYNPYGRVAQPGVTRPVPPVRSYADRAWLGSPLTEDGHAGEARAKVVLTHGGHLITPRLEAGPAGHGMTPG